MEVDWKHLVHPLAHSVCPGLQPETENRKYRMSVMLKSAQEETTAWWLKKGEHYMKVTWWIYVPRDLYPAMLWDNKNSHMVLQGNLSWSHIYMASTLLLLICVIQNGRNIMCFTYYPRKSSTQNIVQTAPPGLCSAQYWLLVTDSIGKAYIVCSSTAQKETNLHALDFFF